MLLAGAIPQTALVPLNTTVQNLLANCSGGCGKLRDAAYAEGNGGKSTKYCPSLPMCLGRHRAVEAIPHDANAIGYALDIIYTRVLLQKPLYRTLLQPASILTAP